MTALLQDREQDALLLLACFKVSDIKGNPIRILLVEDNPGDAGLLRESLTEVESGRFDLTHVSTLSAGVGCLAESVIDPVLSQPLI